MLLSPHYKYSLYLKKIGIADQIIFAFQHGLGWFNIFDSGLSETLSNTNSCFWHCKCGSAATLLLEHVCEPYGTM